MDAVTIYHNPACTTPRLVLALRRERELEPHGIDYRKTPPEAVLDILRHG